MLRVEHVGECEVLRIAFLRSGLRVWCDLFVGSGGSSFIYYLFFYFPFYAVSSSFLTGCLFVGRRPFLTPVGGGCADFFSSKRSYLLVNLAGGDVVVVLL